MELNTLQFFYDDAQDRLLLRIAVIDNGAAHELRAWLTRRFVPQLWSAMQQALVTRVSLARPDAVHASTELIDMARQSAIRTLTSHGAFGTGFRTDLPPHAECASAFLVAEAKFHVAAEGPIRINFLPAEGSGFELTLDDTEFHGFFSLLQQTVPVTGWDQPLTLEGAWNDDATGNGPLKDGHSLPRLLN